LINLLFYILLVFVDRYPVSAQPWGFSDVARRVAVAHVIRLFNAGLNSCLIFFMVYLILINQAEAYDTAVTVLMVIPIVFVLTLAGMVYCWVAGKQQVDP